MPLLSRAWTQLFSGGKLELSNEDLSSFKGFSCTAFWCCRWWKDSKESKMEGPQPCCLPLAPVICVSIRKLVCMLYVLMARSAGAQRNRVMPTGFHTGSNQLQWLATAQPWNVQRVVRKNYQETTNFKMALCGGVAARCLPHHSTITLPHPSQQCRGRK